jgi:G3E family GTPase
MTDRDIAQHYAIDGVVTVVDTLHGAATLDHHPEARRQVALADRLLLSKTDLAAPSAALRERLAALNLGAPMEATLDAAPTTLFGSTHAVDRLATLPKQPAPSPFVRADHTGGIETFSLQRDRPIPALALPLLLEALAEHCGARLLRLKGLVNIQEMPDQPAVIHGVQHVFAPPEFLARWPSADRTTRIVFIAQGIPRHFPARLLDAIEQEVREELEQNTPPR